MQNNISSGYHRELILFGWFPCGGDMLNKRSKVMGWNLPQKLYGELDSVIFKLLHWEIHKRVYTDGYQYQLFLTQNSNLSFTFTVNCTNAFSIALQSEHHKFKYQICHRQSKFCNCSPLLNCHLLCFNVNRQHMYVFVCYIHSGLHQQQQSGKPDTF